MDFRQLLNKIDVLSEGLTLSTLIAQTSGYEQDPAIRFQMVAKLARQAGFAGLVDPASGKYIPSDYSELGDEEDEIPNEDEVEKLSAAGLLPQSAHLPEAGWFDNDTVYNAARSHWTDQSKRTADKHNLITTLAAKKAELQKQIIDFVQNLQNRGVEIPPEILKKVEEMKRGTPNTPPSPPPPSLGSDSMNNLAKNRITPNAPTLSEAIILSMNEDFDWKGAADSASDYAQAFGRNFWNGATYGAGPETYGAAKSYANDTKAKDEIQNQRNLLAKSQKEHPYLSTAANLAGGIASPISKLGVAKSLGAAAGIGAGAYGVDQAMGIGDEKPEEMTADFQNWLNSQGANLDISGQPDQATLDAIDQIILGAKK
jgi:hypothetical protein